MSQCTLALSEYPCDQYDGDQLSAVSQSAVAMPLTTEVVNVAGLQPELEIQDFDMDGNRLFFSAFDSDATGEEPRVRLVKYNLSNNNLTEFEINDTAVSQFKSADVLADRGHVVFALKDHVVTCNSDCPKTNIYTLPSGASELNLVGTEQVGRVRRIEIQGITSKRFLVENTVRFARTQVRAFSLDGSKPPITIPVDSQLFVHRDAIYFDQGCLLRKLPDASNRFKTVTDYGAAYDGAPYCIGDINTWNNAIYSMKTVKAGQSQTGWSCQVWRHNNTGWNGQVLLTIEDRFCGGFSPRDSVLGFSLADPQIADDFAEYWQSDGTVNGSKKLEEVDQQKVINRSNDIQSVDAGEFFSIRNSFAVFNTQLWFRDQQGQEHLIYTTTSPLWTWRVANNKAYLLQTDANGKPQLTRTVGIEVDDPKPAKFVILATPDREGIDNYGWLQYPSGEKHWIDATCRQQLVDQGIEQTILPWTDINLITDRAYQACEDIDIREPKIDVLYVTPDRATAGYGWIALEQKAKQWVDVDCRVSLEESDIELRVADWSVIKEIPDSEDLLSCDALLER